MQLSVVAHPMSDHRVGAAERGDIGLTMFSSPQKNENSFFFLITPKEWENLKLRKKFYVVDIDFQKH